MNMDLDDHEQSSRTFLIVEDDEYTSKYMRYDFVSTNHSY